MANSGFLRSSAPTSPSVRSMMVAGIGAFVAITVLLYLQAASQLTWLMASFGASCLIVFALPDSPLAQPRNVIGGHVLSAATGIAMAHFIGVIPVSMALAVALAIVLMLWTRTPHPPAGANPIIVMVTGSSWSFLLFPVLFGAVVLVGVACAMHKLNHQTYPKHWW